MIAPFASFFCCVAGGALGGVYGGTGTPASGSVMGGIAGPELPPKREASKPPFLGASSAVIAGSADLWLELCSSRALNALAPRRMVAGTQK